MVTRHCGLHPQSRGAVQNNQSIPPLPSRRPLKTVCFRILISFREFFSASESLQSVRKPLQDTAFRHHSPVSEATAYADTRSHTASCTLMQQRVCTPQQVSHHELEQHLSLIPRKTLLNAHARCDPCSQGPACRPSQARQLRVSYQSSIS